MRANQQTKLTVNEVKALQDVRRLAVRFASSLNAVEKLHFVKAFAASAVALTKVENQVSQTN